MQCSHRYSQEAVQLIVDLDNTKETKLHANRGLWLSFHTACQEVLMILSSSLSTDISNTVLIVIPLYLLFS